MKAPTVDPPHAPTVETPNALTADLSESADLRSKCRKGLSEFREQVRRTTSENRVALAESREALDRSWLALTKTTRIVR